MRHRNPIIAGLVLVLVLSGCRQAEVPPEEPVPVVAPAATAPADTGGDRTGVVTETANAGGYTYVQVDTGEESFWAAAPQFVVSVGDTVVVPEGMPMNDFHSATLDRDFDVVFFVAGIRVGTAVPAPAAGGAMPAGHPPIGGGTAPAASKPADVEPLANGQRVGAIVSDPATYAGQVVAVRGQVVKVNSGIMGKNWLHIQDGTGDPGKDDLTVTTDALARVGDTVVVRGVVSVDRDFGFGYAYDVLVEDAEVTVE